MIEANLHLAGLRVDVVFRRTVADIPQCLAHDVGGGIAHLAEVLLVPGAEFAGDQDLAVCREALASHARVRVEPQEGIEDRVRNLVADLVGVASGDRLRCEQTVTE